MSKKSHFIWKLNILNGSRLLGHTVDFNAIVKIFAKNFEKFERWTKIFDRV